MPRREPLWPPVGVEGMVMRPGGPPRRLRIVCCGLSVTRQGIRSTRLLAPITWARAAVLLAFLVLFVSAGAVQAQTPVSGEATVDRTTVTLGDRITYTITVRVPPDVQITPPGDTQAFGLFDILERHSPQERTLNDGRREIRMTFVVAAFRATGNLALPGLTIPYLRADGGRSEIQVPAVPVTVRSVLPGQTPADIRDLKPQLSVPGAPSRWPYFWMALAVLVLLALVPLVVVWRRRRVRPVSEAPASPLLPEDVARAELDRIATLNLLDQGDFSTYHRLIAGVVRRYLTDRYGFPGFALTTTELQQRMVGHGVDRWQARLVSGLLRECDAVVYAGYRPAPARADANLTMAYEIIEMTRPAPLLMAVPSRNGERATA